MPIRNFFKFWLRKRGLVGLALCVFALAGCGATNFEYRSQTEIPEGPGMFSGDKGGLMYSSKDQGDIAAKETRHRPSAPWSPVTRAPENDYREFRQFEEFQRWKEAHRDSAEYREFREWQEWEVYRAGKRNGS